MRMPPEKFLYKKRLCTSRRGTLGRVTLLIFQFLAFVAARGAAGQTAEEPRVVIERVEFLGNRRVRSDTLRARLFVRPGDAYHEETLRRDFKDFGTPDFLKTFACASRTPRTARAEKL